MRVTVRVRIKPPVPAVELLDAVTIAVGGDPETVQRDEAYPCEIYRGMNRVSNEPAPGLDAMAWVLWATEPDHGFPEEPEPPARVLLIIDTSGELHPIWDDLEQLDRTNVLPVVRDWLDHRGVPRTSWWWCCEDLGYFPGTTDIATLTTQPHDLRALPPETRWSPEQT